MLSTSEIVGSRARVETMKQKIAIEVARGQQVPPLFARELEQSKRELIERIEDYLAGDDTATPRPAEVDGIEVELASLRAELRAKTVPHVG